MVLTGKRGSGVQHTRHGFVQKRGRMQVHQRVVIHNVAPLRVRHRPRHHKQYPHRLHLHLIFPVTTGLRKHRVGVYRVVCGQAGEKRRHAAKDVQHLRRLTGCRGVCMELRVWEQGHELKARAYACQSPHVFQRKQRLAAGLPPLKQAACQKGMLSNGGAKP